MLSCARSLEGNQSVSTLVCEFSMIFSWKVFNNFYQFSVMVIPWRQARDIYNGPVSYLSRHIFEGRTDCARFYDSIAWCQYSLMEILLCRILDLPLLQFLIFCQSHLRSHSPHIVTKVHNRFVHYLPHLSKLVLKMTYF